MDFVGDANRSVSYPIIDINDLQAMVESLLYQLIFDLIIHAITAVPVHKKENKR